MIYNGFIDMYLFFRQKQQLNVNFAENIYIILFINIKSSDWED